MSAAMEEPRPPILLGRSPEHPCPYLKDRPASEYLFQARAMDPEDYHVLMDMGWRRSGYLFYRPCCPDCAACVPIRLRPAAFRPSRSQRRVWRRNQDLRVTIDEPTLTDEKHDVYVRFLRSRHDGTMGEDVDDLRRFLYESPVQTREVCYRLGSRLVGVGIVDVSSRAASTVYYYFDPDEHRRSPGVFSVLWEIDWSRRQGLEHYYLGYVIRSLPSMSYKANFRPHELLGPDDEWRPAGGV